MSDVVLDWSSAEVDDGKLDVPLRGELGREWKVSFKQTLALLPGGNWGTVKLKKDRVRVHDISQGREDDVRVTGRASRGVAVSAGGSWVGLFPGGHPPNWRTRMPLGTSLFLIAVGAILRFAITVTTHGFSLRTIGDILMIVGGVGLVLALFWMTAWSPRRVRYARDPYQRGERYDEDPVR
ncbi:MAG TPA: hypothetical protein VG223_18615 [Solirubrobacteraceae bacterium]|nr:hypothetical protein [Solirubrobacteraceae bacterium]